MAETSRHKIPAERLQPIGEHRATDEADGLGNRYVTDAINHVVQYTPAAGVIANGPADAILLSADTTATIVAGEDEDADSVTVPLAPKVWHRLAVKKVTAVGSGNVFLGWIRRPPEL